MKLDVIRRRILAATALSPALMVKSGWAASRGVRDDKIIIGSFLPLQSGLAAGAVQLRDGADA